MKKFKTREELEAFIRDTREMGMETTSRIAEHLGDKLLDQRYSINKKGAGPTPVPRPPARITTTTNQE